MVVHKLELKQETIPKDIDLQDHQVLVQMQLIPIQNCDILQCSGILGGPPSAGSEGLATVIRVGEKVTKYRENDRVLVVAWPVFDHEQVMKPESRISLWSSYVICTEDYLFPLPDTVDDLDGSQMFICPLTAYGMIFDALNMKQDQYLIISGSSSTLGFYINRFAQTRGINVINLVRTENQIGPLKELGYENMFVYNTEDTTSWDPLIGNIMELTRGGADGGIDMIGGKVPNLILNSMKPFTKMISVGTSSNQGIDISSLITTGRLIVEGKSIEGFSVNSCWVAKSSKEKILQCFAECCEYFNKDKDTVHCILGNIYTFSNIKEAMLYLRSHSNLFGGKVFISPNESTSNQQDFSKHKLSKE